ncbi:protein Brevis radix-like 1 [Cryptomeria japonica]|uniref:protein Brevis radix-like 1 n=1 Tax=Cryptomeria japonica TaxID=3369 RepID=UPI0027DA802B|nr:protein Brevis radix-like 1 [Cryptomeria japonica]
MLLLIMGRNRLRLFSVVLDCFAPEQRYEEDNNNNNNNNVELPQHIEEGGEGGGGGGGGEESTEDFEQGVHITVQRLAGGSRQVKRIKFSREVFSEMQARLWWEENRVRVHEHYSSTGN